MKLRSRINTFLAREVLIDLDNISRDNAIPSNNRKVDLIVQTLNKYGIDYTRIAPGTNRYSILIDNYVFKIALDKRGKVDNWAEFYLSKEMQPFVTRTYECNGLIAVAEYIAPLTKEEFISNKDKIRKILDTLSKDWLFGDMGTITKNFMNWGVRSNNKFVCLDYAYTYRILGNEMICGNKKKTGEICDGFLEYDEDFSVLRCPSCGKKYDFIDIRNRMRSNYEDEVRENAKKMSIQFPQGVEELEVADEELDQINNEEDIEMNYNEDNFNKYTEEDIDAMLSAEIEKCYAPIEVREDEPDEEVVSPVIDMRAADEIMTEVLVSENDYVEESPITKEMIAKRKFEQIVEEMSMPKEFYEGMDEDEWYDDPDVVDYYEEEPTVDTTDYPNLDNIIDDTFHNSIDDVEELATINTHEEVTSSITIIDENETDELGDAIFDYFTNNVEEELEVVENNVVEEELEVVENIETPTNMDDVILTEDNDDMLQTVLEEDDDRDSSDIVLINNMIVNNKVNLTVDIGENEPFGAEELIIGQTEDDIEETINEEISKPKEVKIEEPVRSFIKVLDEDNNESVDSMRSSLLEDDDYDDQYDDLYDQAIKDSKFRNNNRNY